MEIKPTILEKQKYENEEHSLEVNPNLTSGSIDFIENTEYKQTSLVSTYELPKSGSLKRGYIPEGIPTSESDAIIPSLTGSKLELPYTASIKISDSGSSTVVTNLSSSIVNPFSGSISVISSTLTTGSMIVLPYSGSFDYASDLNKSFINIHDSYGKGNVTGSDTHFPNYAHEVEPTQTTSSVSFTFFSSSAHNSTITLTSFDGENEVSKSYLVTTSSAVSNGDFTADSSSILFLTGSGGTGGVTSSQAGNFLAAVSSSNGHGLFGIVSGSFTLSRTNGTVTIKQPFAGTLPIEFSASFSNTMTSSISQSSTRLFRGGTKGYGGDFNVGHIDTRYKFISIGDCEYYSASRAPAYQGEKKVNGLTIAGGHGSSHFTNHNNFYNKIVIKDDVHKNAQYVNLRQTNPTNHTLFLSLSETLESTFADVGRAMGKTRYYVYVTDEPNGFNIQLPSNHVTKFSQPFKEQMINGAQNTNPGFLNVRYEDYSSASFYRVKVTGGDNQIKIQSGTPGKGNDDKIIYG